MAAHAQEPETARDQKADRETGFPGLSAQPFAQRDDVCAARTTTTGMDERRWQTTVGRLGRERPSPHRPAAKSAGENPGSLTPQCPALTRRRAGSGQQRTPPALHRPSPQGCASPPVRSRQAAATIATLGLADFLMPAVEGTAHLRASSHRFCDLLRAACRVSTRNARRCEASLGTRRSRRRSKVSRGTGDAARKAARFPSAIHCRRIAENRGLRQHHGFKEAP